MRWSDEAIQAAENLLEDSDENRQLVDDILDAASAVQFDGPVYQLVCDTPWHEESRYDDHYGECFVQIGEQP